MGIQQSFKRFLTFSYHLSNGWIKFQHGSPVIYSLCCCFLSHTTARVDCNFAEAKAQYWIQSPKGSDTRRCCNADLDKIKTDSISHYLAQSCIQMYGDDIREGGQRELCEIKHFHPEFITHPLNKRSIWTYRLEPLARQDR